MIITRKVASYELKMEATWIGPDLFVVVRGGDEEHVGAVSVAFLSQSAYRTTTTHSLSTISLPGHKDYVLSNSIAERLCKCLKTTVVVSVGIHIDTATSELITDVVKAVEEMTDEMANAVPSS